MKFLVLLAAAVVCASADVSHIVKDESNAPVVKSDFDIQPDGAYVFSYETGNGISAEAQGAVKNQNSDYPTLEVTGGYRYSSPEGEPIQLTYIANELGYQPQGSHLPVGPPIPEAIARSLAYIAAHPPPSDSVQKAQPAFG